MKLDKSSKECAEHNAQYQLEIEHGVVFAWEPSDEQIKREEKDNQAKMAQGLALTMLKTLIEKAVSASNYVSDIAQVHDRMAKWHPNFNSEYITLGKVNLRVEKYTSWTPGSWHSNGSYYRLCLSGISKWDGGQRRSRVIYKDAACKLNGNATVEKVATWLNEKVGERIRYHSQQAQIESIKQTVEQKKAQLLKENEAAFKVLGVNDVYPGGGTTEGMILAKVQFALTSEQWTALAEWKNNLSLEKEGFVGDITLKEYNQMMPKDE